jgi:hypothetical protein
LSYPSPCLDSKRVANTASPKCGRNVGSESVLAVIYIPPAFVDSSMMPLPAPESGLAKTEKDTIAACARRTSSAPPRHYGCLFFSIAKDYTRCGFVAPDLRSCGASSVSSGPSCRTGDTWSPNNRATAPQYYCSTPTPVPPLPPQTASHYYFTSLVRNALQRTRCVCMPCVRF